MKLIVLGAGRMGIRHIQGILTVQGIEKIVVVDIMDEALSNAKQQLDSAENSDKCEYTLLNDLSKEERFDIGIIASTADNREALFDMLVSMGCSKIMIEKPLGQSMEEIQSFVNKVSTVDVDCSVNLNMRLYDCFIELKNDLNTTPQLQGLKTVTINTGTIGIGANGIHYLDLLFFLFDADSAEIKAAYIDDQIIPSGRSTSFGDFGGWMATDFIKDGEKQATALVSLSARSTVFGSWDIVAPHGRIYFNEVEQKRVNSYRKEDSTLPMNRYYGDYMPPVESKFGGPFLGDLTAKWVVGLQNGTNMLPSIKESLKAHQLMFDWLNHSKTHQGSFPIT